MEVVAVIAIFVSGFTAGLVLMLIRQLRQVEAKLVSQVEEFAIITRRASEANLSLADKIVEFQKRLEALEFRATAGNFIKK